MTSRPDPADNPTYALGRDNSSTGTTNTAANLQPVSEYVDYVSPTNTGLSFDYLRNDCAPEGCGAEDQIERVRIELRISVENVAPQDATQTLTNRRGSQKSRRLMIQRLARDESGMTMGLAIMMILLISVMGAGLLIFVSRVLNSVIEENRGQRAFEVADAGIEAVKRQLASDVITTDYNDPIVDPPAPVDDIQWSAAAGGLTLNDLDGKDLDGAGPLEDPTQDSVKVTIEYLGDETEEFRVISEGTYGNPPQQAKRRIEAIFGAADLGISDDDNSARPSYYTPSSILIDGPKVSIKGISMFSRQDILIEDPAPLTPYSASDFHAEYDSNNGVTLDTIPNPREELCD